MEIQGARLLDSKYRNEEQIKDNDIIDKTKEYEIISTGEVQYLLFKKRSEENE